MVTRIVIIGIIVAGVIAGIFTALIVITIPVDTFDDDQDVSLTPEEINKLEQSERIPSQFIKITNSNSKFFEKWCHDQNGKWDINQSQIGGVCFFDSRTEKIKAEIEWDKLQHPVVSGDDAQKICHVLDLKCNPDAEFEGWFDDETGHIKLDYSLHDEEYSFRIQGDSLEYSRSDVSNTWYSYDDDPVLGQTLFFKLSDDFYFAGDEIRLSGKIWNHAIVNSDETPVILQVSLDDDLIEVAQIPVSSEKIFSYQIKTEGPQWQQSGRYTVTASYDSGKMQEDFGFSTYYSDKPVKYFTDFDSEDYEELCGYPVTHDMRRDFIESWKSRHDDRDPFVTIRQGTFTHVERSNYLADIPILHYWYDLKNGKATYFAMEACSLDDYVFRGEPGPNWEKPQDFVIDDITYVELNAPGGPLIYKDTLLPVLDEDNCKKIAKQHTEQERGKMYTRENPPHNQSPPWKNQLLPLMNYCQSIGTFELKTDDGNINWSFVLK